MNRLDSLRAFALALPHTTVVKQWGDNLVFKVADKVFFLISLDTQVIEGLAFKCAPAEFDRLTEIDGITQAPYFARRHWVRVTDPAALPAAELQRRIHDSHRLDVGKLPVHARRTLGL